MRLVAGLLYRETAGMVPRDKELRLVVPWSLRKEMIRLVHEGITGGHAGITRTKDQVQRRAFWPGWTKSVELFVKACHPCSRYHRGSAPRRGLLHPGLASHPFETMGIDVTGPHPKSAIGYVYILTAVDHYSKFAFAFPMRYQEANTSCKTVT